MSVTIALLSLIFQVIATIAVVVQVVVHIMAQKK